MAKTNTNVLTVLTACHEVAQATGSGGVNMDQLATILTACTSDHKVRGALLELLYDAAAIGERVAAGRPPAEPKPRTPTTAGGMKRALLETLHRG